MKVRGRNCIWIPTNVLIAIWNIEKVSHYVFAPRIFITSIITIVLYWDKKWMLGFLINITKINLALIPTWQPQGRDLFSISTEFISINSHQTPHFWMDCSALPIKGMTETKDAWRRCLRHVLLSLLCSSEYQTVI